MDDLSQKLNDLLRSPDSLEKIRAAMASLGMDGGDSDSPPEKETDGDGSGGALQALLAGLGESPMAESRQEKSAPKESGGLPDLSMLAKLAPLMAGMNKEDENTALLHALRPYLHGDREKRLDGAIQILKFMRILPLLQEKDPAE